MPPTQQAKAMIIRIVAVSIFFSYTFCVLSEKMNLKATCAHGKLKIKCHHIPTAWTPLLPPFCPEKIWIRQKITNIKILCHLLLRQFFKSKVKNKKQKIYSFHIFYSEKSMENKNKFWLKSYDRYWLLKADALNLLMLGISDPQQKSSSRWKVLLRLSPLTHAKFQLNNRKQKIYLPVVWAQFRPE